MENLKENLNEKINNSSLSQQQEIEKVIQSYFDLYNFKTKGCEEYNENIEVFKDNHVDFVMKQKNSLSGGYAALDSGLPWFAYWVLNIFDIFGMDKYNMSYDYKKQFIIYLKHLLGEDGGFSGYSYGYSHMISTYAAVLAVVSLDCEEAYEIIDRKKMKEYLLRMKNNDFKYENKSQDNNSFTIKDRTGNFVIKKPITNDFNNEKISNYSSNSPGTFQVHSNGESDLRSTYCALVVAYLLNIMDDDITDGVAENIKACQTFEGGLGPEPFSEAHGGYNFCGIASLLLLNKLDIIDVDKQLKWLVNRQMTVEGGFQGRTNKLVDSCYSFWQGAVFNMLLDYDSKRFNYCNECLYNQLALQAYILMACQVESGGMLDKPGKKPDFFHLNYAGTGLSLSQKSLHLQHPEIIEKNNDVLNKCSTNVKNEIKNDEKEDDKKCYYEKGYLGYRNFGNKELTVGISYHESMDLTEMDAVFCLPKEKVSRAVDYFIKKGKL